MNKKYYPKNKSKVSWEKEGIKISYRKNPSFDHYCGYCEFDSRPTKEQGYNGILTYVPVHGGITYAEELDDHRMIYGFDCGHAEDEHKSKLKDIKWLKKECENMAYNILLAKTYEDKYLLADNKEKAEIIDSYIKNVKGESDAFENFGVLINILAGKL